MTVNVCQMKRNMCANYNIHTLAGDTLKKSLQSPKHYYNRNVIEVTYEAGDMVRRNQQKVVVWTKSK